ncbi:unnamed protein product [Macrosiphum euphorbiae]|uniref:Protein ALP1-like n=1 Tax=Macrosiphum euphorbiae TaxID=13131 RepID=A0AAV0Y7Y2_9HEMI|nr:unnamed protein product [Macrosiphum euphorbiae]
MDLLNDEEAMSIIYVLYKRHQKKSKNGQRRHWVHPLNLKRPIEGRFQTNFMTLRSYPEEFFKYYRMSIKSFDELISLVNLKLQKQVTCLHLPIPAEERLTVTLR